MTSSRRRFCLYFSLCVVTLVCVGELGFWSFCADRFQFQWVVKHVSDSTTSSLRSITSSPTNSPTSSAPTSASTTKAPTSNPTSNPTKAPTSAPTTASRTTRTGEYDNDDGCQLTSHPNNIHWAWKPENENSSSSSAAAADDLSADAAVQEHIRQVHQCTTKFTWTYVGTPSDSDWWSYLKCDISVSTEMIQDLVQKHNHILFVGDSVMHQQYVLFLCMLDPMLDHAYVKEGKVHRYDYRRPDGGGITTLLYESFGRGWPHASNTLYEDSFPKAIETYTEQDAIVVNANSHYDSTKVQLFMDDMRYIAQQAARSNASVYFMEPNAEEWPTANGIFIRDCEKSCRCAALTAERLQGQVPYPEIIQRLLVDSASLTAVASAATTITTIQEEEPATTRETTTITLTGQIPPLWNDLLQFLQERNSHQGDAGVWATQIDSNNFDMVNNAPCFPECLPATWRTEVARAILLDETSLRTNHSNNDNDDVIATSDQRQSNSRTTTTAAVVHLVPTFLQLATHRGHSAWQDSRDCTHRALDAVIMLNEQLIRIMLKKVHHHPTAPTTLSSSDMMPLALADYST